MPATIAAWRRLNPGVRQRVVRDHDSPQSIPRALRILDEEKRHSPGTHNEQLGGQYLKPGVITQYKKAPTFAVRCEWLQHHTYRKGAPL